MDRPPDEGRDEDATTTHVRRAVAGEISSLSWLVKRLSPLLLAQARYRLGSVLDAIVAPEDIVQQVWLVTISNMRQFAPRDGRITPVLLAYLAKTVRGLATNHLRKALRRQ